MSTSLVSLPSQGVSLFVRDEGRGPPIVVMHGGLGADHSTMLPLLPLARDARLIFYDHRGNGRSTRCKLSSVNWDTLTADAEALRRELRIDKWAVLGHSFGGMVALEYALRYPESIDRLILLDTGGDASVVREGAPDGLRSKGRGPRVVAAASRFYSGKIDRREFLKSMALLGPSYYHNRSPLFLSKELISGLKIRADAAVCIHGFKELLAGWSVMSRLGEICIPTLILAGEDDFQFPSEHQKELEKGIRGSSLHAIPNAGHNAHIERPREVMHYIKQFLESDDA